jgi:hypothetical protein
MNIRDLTGERFGRWTVIESAGHDNRELLWFVQCDCGTERVLRGGILKSGRSNSCGCLKTEILKNKHLENLGEAVKNTVISGYKKHAKERGLSFELTDEQVLNIMNKKCHYCGREPSNIRKNRYDDSTFTYSGMDRKDNSKGYLLKNVVPCCQICNHAKDVLSEDEFLAWVKQICEFRNL